MLSKKLEKLLPTIIFIVVAVIVSMLLLSFFKVDLGENGLRVLNRSAVYEGMCNSKKHKEGLEDDDDGANLILDDK
tara:strand:- start:7665 stop:7892 length:228 start_codon:yes stop_codon:yes gene_type:complete